VLTNTNLAPLLDAQVQTAVLYSTPDNSLQLEDDYTPAKSVPNLVELEEEHRSIPV
jgi:hypothetical protein